MSTNEKLSFFTQEDWGFGSVVLAAQDGLLSDLGHKVSELGTRALGFVAETRNNKCYVQFPELALAIWLEKDELADVFAESRSGKNDFLNLIPDMNKAFSGEKVATVWWMAALAQGMGSHMLLSFEKGLFSELWDGEAQNSVSPQESVIKIGLGLEELYLEKWALWSQRLQPLLIVPRFLPAGMHKMELQLYFKKSALL